ncbi:hypothetical protein COOONC_24918 [Cooperia oncophora]
MIDSGIHSRVLLGFSEYYVAHLELTVQKAVAQQTSIEWEPICSNLLPIIRRQMSPNIYEQTDCKPLTIAMAPWSNWSECVNG